MSAARTTERIDALDGLRGALAIGVMTYHLLIFEYDVHLRSLGSYAVFSFFVLSGFAIRWAATPVDGEPFPIRSYTVSRLARIVPLWWVAVLGTMVRYLPDRFAWSTVIENLTLMFALTPTSDIPLGGWSIEVELVFYLLFPIAAMLFRSVRSLVALLIAALVVRSFYVAGDWTSSGPTDVVRFRQMPTFLPYFAGGMLLAELRRRSAARNDVWTFLAGSGLLLGVFMVDVDPWTLLGGPLSVVLTLACIAAVGLVAWAPNPTGTTTRWLCTTVGAVSYGTYLLHPLVYAGLSRLGIGRLGTVLMTSVGTLVLAWSSHRYFEMPAGRFIRSRWARPALGA